jgi:hypothetical protein
MDQSINISLINDQITNNRRKVTNIDDYYETQTKITVYDFFSINEIKIGEILTKIPYYINYYDIFVDYDFLDIGKIGEKVIENVDLDTKYKGEKYIVFNYNDEKRIGFREFLFNLSFGKKQFIFNILNTYSILLDSLSKLNDNDVCFFELSSESNRTFDSSTKNVLSFYYNAVYSRFFFG